MLETERLILRKLTADDAETLYRIYHEPDVLKYFTQGPPESIDAERAGIQRHQLDCERHGFGLWATVLRETGELIGRCGLLAKEMDGAEEIEVAYLLSPRFWGRGLATEAACAIRDYAFGTLGHSHLVSIIHPGNLASKRVATAMGMSFSRTSRLDNLEVEVYSITRSPNEAAAIVQPAFSPTMKPVSQPPPSQSLKPFAQEAGTVTSMTATFLDKRGAERIVIHTNGLSLATSIRGIDFIGTDFDSLTPATASDQFDLCHGDLCGFELNVAIPARLVSPNGLRRVEIHAEIILGHQGPCGGLDKEIVRTRLTQPEFTIVSGGDSGWFEGELLSLAAQLPNGFLLQTCITCGLSDYSPYGHGCFGSLACFRDVADDYRQVCTKVGIFAIWGRLTEYVQETHYCQHYEARPPGRGYRG